MTMRHLVGIDEVGRGPLAGPVTVCALRVESGFDFSHFKDIKDSKKLSPQKREEWFLKISDLKSKGELEFASASVSAAEIDSIGISRAIEKAIHVALDALSLVPESTHVFLDGSLRAPKRFLVQETIIKGDEKIPVISAASIVAKVMRDRHMEEQAAVYPGYGLENHKGYGTDEHCKAIRKLGPSPIHRKSFIGGILPAFSRGKKGFTLIELLVVVSIISLLASVVLSALNSARAKARDADRKEQISSIMNAMYLYAQDNGGNFPSIGGTACLGVGDGSTCWGDRNIPGNTSLMNALKPYMSSIPSDPNPGRGWGDHYLYLDGATSNTGCDANSTAGKYILWRPDAADQSPSSFSCLGKGYFSCCGTGAPCNNNGGYYCAFKFD
ncbi:MAG TPA: ribonuclease HII [Candidatus Paceibacterota bacterium]|nr:ribonuclease HII [Candidatus Paceibacterota bacterium]